MGVGVYLWVWYPCTSSVRLREAPPLRTYVQGSRWVDYPVASAGVPRP